MSDGGGSVSAGAGCVGVRICPEGCVAHVVGRGPDALEVVFLESRARCVVSVVHLEVEEEVGVSKERRRALSFPVNFTFDVGSSYFWSTWS